MSWFLRKAFKIGPFRFNLSKSGVGVSAGVTGARVGIRPDGRAYTHAGRFGLYHRQELGKLGSKPQDPDLDFNIKIEGIRAKLKFGIDKDQAKPLWEMAQEKGDTVEVKIELLEAVSDCPKFWEKFHEKRESDKKDWDETIENIWNALFEKLDEMGVDYK
jgi:hypothetical protein